VLLICAGLLGSSPPDPTDYQAAAARAGRDAGAHVKLAVWCEAHGLDAERLKQLAALALFNRWPEVPPVAIEALKRRDPRDYMDAMIGLMGVWQRFATRRAIRGLNSGPTWLGEIRLRLSARLLPFFRVPRR
jgi:hypothetical protein